jgi:D-aminopeptidase
VAEQRKRVRELGVEIGRLPTGRLNAITDVAGVQVGHCTVRFGTSDDPPGSGPARTGVTAIWPHRDDLVRRPVAAGFFALSATGEMTGRSQIEELGRINTPIGLTNTMSVGTVYEGICRYLVERDDGVGDGEGVQIPVAAECDDSYLHDARGFHVTTEHVFKALDSANDGPVPEGAVGSGTGMHSFKFKGGIGTSSRVVNLAGNRWTVGVLTMTNFGARHRLTVDGVPVGRHFPLAGSSDDDTDEGSGIVVIATDAPLDSRQLARVAKRASLGLGRTGSIGADGSGELLIAFSTSYHPDTGNAVAEQRIIESSAIDKVFEAVVDATEESVLNALCMAETIDGRYGRVLEALPLDELEDLLRSYGRLNGDRSEGVTGPVT